jgi:hypothetical protein
MSRCTAPVRGHSSASAAKIVQFVDINLEATVHIHQIMTHTILL